MICVERCSCFIEPPIKVSRRKCAASRFAINQNLADISPLEPSIHFGLDCLLNAFHFLVHAQYSIGQTGNLCSNSQELLVCIVGVRVVQATCFAKHGADCFAINEHQAIIDSSVSFADKSTIDSSVSFADTSTIDSSVSFADTSVVVSSSVSLLSMVRVCNSETPIQC